MSKRISVALRVEMGGRDISEFVQSFQFVQPPNALYREFQIVLSGWSNIQPGERWDVWGSYDSAEPKAELLIRQGVVPPDRQPDVEVIAGEPPKITVKGFDSVWVAQRRTPRQTIVIAPSTSDAAQAIQRHRGPIGRYQVHTLRPMTIKRVVSYLGHCAGINVECRVPNVTIAPFVVPPASSYWRAISDLVAPWAPYIYFKAETNTVVITDPVSAQVGIGPVLSIPDSLVKSLSGIPSRTKRIQRVLITVAQ